MLGLLLVVLSGAAPVFGVAGPARGADALHPKDGPDADIRLVVGDDALTATLILNLAFCDGIVDVPREDPQSLPEPEQEPLREALIERLRADFEVTIDGVAVPFVERAFEASEPELYMLPLFPTFGMRALRRVRLVLDYPLKSMPESIGLVWGAYPPDAYAFVDEDVPPPPMEVQAKLAAEGRSWLITFHQAEPGFTWYATGETIADRMLDVPVPPEPETLWVPMASVGLLMATLGVLASLARAGDPERLRRAALIVAPIGILGALLLSGVATVEVEAPWASGPALPTDAEALAIFGPLHENIYRAFDYAAESEIYDALSGSVDGDLLDDLYNQVYRSLILQEEGGAMSRVAAVRPLESQIEEIGVMGDAGRPGFQVRRRWQVDGVVHHWGHSHSRTNEYEARYQVVLGEAGSGWRIAGHQPLAQKRIGAEPLPDGASPFLTPSGAPLDTPAGMQALPGQDGAGDGGVPQDLAEKFGLAPGSDL